MTNANPDGLGFVGTGTITAAIVTGLCLDTDFDVPITVSPRNAVVASELAQRFGHVHVARSNQDVLDRSRIVFLAVRPQIADDVIHDLKFRTDHHVISLIATYSLERISALVAPAGDCVCAVPQPTVAARAGPTVQFPPDALTASLFKRLGPVVEVDSEVEFRALFAATSAMAAHFAWLDAMTAWLVRHAIDPSRARAYVASMFQGLGGVPISSAKTFDELSQEFKTRGGLNEQFAGHLAERHVFESCATGLDAIFERLSNASGTPRVA
jgi:pyrroline-5-carboxylate reductase